MLDSLHTLFRNHYFFFVGLSLIITFSYPLITILMSVYLSRKNNTSLKKVLNILICSSLRKPCNENSNKHLYNLICFRYIVFRYSCTSTVCGIG